MNNTNNSNVSNSVINANSNANTVTETDVLNHMKGLKFHTIILFKNKDGKVIDALSIDNSFTKERLTEYQNKYQYGDKIPENLRAPKTFSEWWEQLDVKQYFKNQMEKDYLMSLYIQSLDDPTIPSNINVEHHTISVNTDSDVTDFLDFLNDLREKLGVKMQGGGTPLEDKIFEKRTEYEETIKNIKKTKDLYDKYGNLPIVKEIFGKAAIQELIKTMPKDRLEDELKKLYEELEAIVNANTSTIPIQQPQQQTLTKEAIITMLKTPKTYDGLFNP
jgi:hypothetical protein